MNLLIVDDEPLIHVSIECCLKELNLEDIQIYHASTGSEMWARMEEARMDIALVDIRMPGVNGLEAIEEGRRRWPDTFYYIMSGYSEFEYAREAVRLSVTEYLLKPLEPKTLAAVIEHVREDRAVRGNQIRDAFRSWMTGTLHRHDVGYLYVKDYVTALLLLTYDSPQNDNWIPEFMYEHQETLLSLPCDEGLLLLAFSQDPALVYEITRGLLKHGYPKGVTVFVSAVCQTPEELGAQMRRLLDFSPVRVFRGIETRYDAILLSDSLTKEAAAGKQWITLRDCYFDAQYEAYLSQCARLSTTLETGKTGYLPAFLEAMTGIDFSDAASAGELTQRLRGLGESLLEKNKSIDKIDAAIAYLEENFCQDISLSALAARFSLSPNYLSTLLKKRLGVKFTDYLTGLRIAHSKKLLITSSLSIKEITARVGYYSESHFIKVFLERENCTPAEFRSRKNSPDRG